MSREIKFRGWYPSVKKMRNFSDGIIIADDQDRYGMFFKCTEGNVFLSKCEVMQYTGLKDKNGKEIYEDDIVKALKHNEDQSTNQIVWRSGSLWFGNWNWVEFQNIFRGIEVIGNIHENKGLTEDKQ